MDRRSFVGVSMAALLAGSPGRGRERDEVRLTGVGASLPAPLYLAWFRAFRGADRDVVFDYQSTGSGTGIISFTNRVVHFAASDAVLSDAQIAAVEGGAVVLPMTAGEIVLTFNLRGVAALRLPRDVYPLLFSGEIDRWNDPRLLAANPGVDLPDRPVVVVARSDASGTTDALTRHLAAVDPGFAAKVGVGPSVPWPAAGKFIEAPRNDGVTALVGQTPGAIGYVEHFYAAATGLPVAALGNRAGRFVLPGERAGQAAIESADFGSDDLRIRMLDPGAAEAYPITTLTWMLFYRRNGDAKVAAALREFVTWAMRDGQKIAAEMGYITLPDVLTARVLARVPLIA